MLSASARPDRAGPPTLVQWEPPERLYPGIRRHEPRCLDRSVKFTAEAEDLRHPRLILATLLRSGGAGVFAGVVLSAAWDEEHERGTTPQDDCCRRGGVAGAWTSPMRRYRGPGRPTPPAREEAQASPDEVADLA